MSQAGDAASEATGGDAARSALLVSSLVTPGRFEGQARLVAKEDRILVPETTPVIEDAGTASGTVDAPDAGDEGPASNKKSKPHGDSLLQWAGSIVTALGVFLALFAAYLFLFTPLQASRAQHRLLSELRPPTGLAVLTGHVPPEGDAVAVLDIPALHLDQVVVQGTSAADLTDGPGLMPGSALPGTPGNTVIAGRRYLYGKPFSALGSLTSGDKIQIVSAYGTFNYKVTGTQVVEPGQSDPIAPTKNNRLTLVTSNASLAPTDRVVAIATLVGSAIDVHVSTIGVPPRSERALSGDANSLLPLILWGIALVAGLLMSVRLYRRWKHTWPTYLMTTPVLLALAVLVFQNLAHLLPATL
jgi:sortase A